MEMKAMFRYSSVMEKDCLRLIDTAKDSPYDLKMVVARTDHSSLAL